MRIKNIFSLLLGIVFLIASTENALPQSTLFKELSGRTTDLKELKGKWVVINFWADWCDPCQREIPHLNSFYKKNQNKVMVYGYHFDQPEKEALKKMVQSFRIQYPVLIEDPSSSLGIKNIFAVPTTCFISPEGVLKECMAGEQSKSSLEKWLYKS